MQKLRLGGALIALAIWSSPCAASADLHQKDGQTVLESTDKQSRISLGGLLQYDGFWSTEGPSRFVDIVRFRRLRVNLAGTLLDDWHFKAEYDLTQFSKSLHEFGRGWRSLWVSYTGIPRWEFRVGNQRSPVSLENVTPSTDTTLLERSSADAFVARYYLGATMSTHGSRWTATFGAFRDAITTRTGSPNRGTTFAGRVTWAAVNDDVNVVHLGVFGSYERFVSSSPFKIAVLPLVDITGHNLVRTRDIFAARSQDLVGVEAGWSEGPILLQGEYMRTDLQEPGRPGPVFDGGYVQASWLLTGERHRYSAADGRFEFIEPLSDCGAVELAARYGVVDLQSGSVRGGLQRDFTFGVNWYVDRHVRVGANYIWAQATPSYRGVDETLTAVLARVQLHL